jgi:hypothetical protein
MTLSAVERANGFAEDFRTLQGGSAPGELLPAVKR